LIGFGAPFTIFESNPDWREGFMGAAFYVATVQCGWFDGLLVRNLFGLPKQKAPRRRSLPGLRRLIQRGRPGLVADKPTAKNPSAGGPLLLRNQVGCRGARISGAVAVLSFVIHCSRPGLWTQLRKKLRSPTGPRSCLEVHPIDLATRQLYPETWCYDSGCG